MYRCSTVRPLLLIALLITGMFTSCYKKNIQFGRNPDESHTRLITIDTVTPVMSTFILDSFATSGTNTILAGAYKDAMLGNTDASTYLQFGLPSLKEDAGTLIPGHAVYDYLELTMKPSGYYYGDTTHPYNISVYKLAAQPDYTYSGKLYNTSAIPLADSLGTFSKRISPSRRDSIRIKLPSYIGQDFYNKIKSKASQMQTEAGFLSYFKGICVRPAGDPGAVITFNVADSSVRMRLHFHVTIPFYEERVIDFYLTRTSYQFNRIITDRSGTTLEPAFPKQREFFASPQNPYSFTQSSTGSLLKIKFPALRELLKINDVVRVLDAKLVLKPVLQTFDDYIYRLPGELYMVQTDATNNFGSPLADTTGQLIQYRAPTIDRLFGEHTAYTFTVTGYINTLLHTAGTTENGLFILQEHPGISKQINRGVFGSRQHAKFQTKLVLTLMTIE